MMQEILAIADPERALQVVLWLDDTASESLPGMEAAQTPQEIAETMVSMLLQARQV